MMQCFEDLINNPTSLYISITVVLLSIAYYFYQTRGIPPGPTGLPYLGYFPFLKNETCHLQLTELSKKYGDVFSFTVTGRLFIHLGSVKAVREAHVTKSDCFAERPDAYTILGQYLNKGVVFMRGDGWRQVRKAFLQQFRERGMNTIKDALSGPMYDTIREAIDDIKKSNGEPIDIAPIILSKCNKVMRQTLLGDDGMTEKEMQDYNEQYFYALMTMSSLHLLVIGDFTQYFIAPFMKGVKDGEKAHKIMIDMLYKMIKKREQTFDEHNIRDCIDGFIKERKDREAKNDPSAKYFTDEILMVSLIQIIGDGVLFLAIFVCTFLKVLLNHPEEQEKIYQEIIDVVGTDRNPEMEDKSKLTYTNAFINEVMRTTDVFTIFPSLECTKETTVGGYRIPKGAITLYNFWCASMNPKDYEEPEKFNPSRFIPKDGKKKPDLLSLFGIGKRSCMGEGYAMIQVFLFLTTLVKNFRLTKPAGHKEGSNLFFYFDRINVCAHPRK